jgi:hypothetical protein
MSPEDETKLAALREAAQVGMGDIEAGRSVRFKTSRELRHYLDDLIGQVVREHRKGRMPRD